MNSMRFDMKQVRKHERLINMAALSVIIFAFSSSVIMVGWFIKQPHLNSDAASPQPHHSVELPTEHTPQEAPAELPPTTGVILI